MPTPNLNPGQGLLDSEQILQRSFDETKDRLRTDGTFTGTIEAEVSVEIDAADGDNIAIANQTGTNFLDVNADGSLNVTLVETPGTTINDYNEISSVASGILTVINSYTMTNSGFLQKIIVSGTNIATFQVDLNGNTIDKKRTWFNGSLNEEFDFSDYSKTGYPMAIGDIIEVKVLHNRPTVGDFNTRIQVVEN